jgi:hypothetical protein
VGKREGQGRNGETKMKPLNGERDRTVKMISKILYLVCLTIFSSVSVERVYGLRCGNNIIDVGDRKIDVLKKCGEPAIADEWYEEDIFRSSPEIDRFGEGSRRKVVVHVEEWTYNFGPTRFTYILTFKNGKLVEVRTGDYGF